jgi:hypothetical protein
MNITLQYFDSCPGWKVVEGRVKDIIEMRSLQASLDYQRIETSEDAERYQFAGSPTLLIDGQDPFATGSLPVGLACRTYLTDAGLAPSPSVEQLEEAMGV